MFFSTFVDHIFASSNDRTHIEPCAYFSCEAQQDEMTLPYLIAKTTSIIILSDSGSLGM